MSTVVTAAVQAPPLALGGKVPTPPDEFKWDVGEMLALSSVNCAVCDGLGSYAGRRCGVRVPCGCVLRAVFLACLRQFRNCVDKPKYLTRAFLGRGSVRSQSQTFHRPDEEYIADFTLIARRTLTVAEYRMLSLAIIRGVEWQKCHSGLNRGNHFHMIYRIQGKLGRAFRETQPYGLYPLCQYFAIPTARVPYKIDCQVAREEVPRGGRWVCHT